MIFIASIFWENISTFVLLDIAFNFKLCFCFEIYFSLLLEFGIVFTGIDKLLLFFLSLLLTLSIVLLLIKLIFKNTAIIKVLLWQSNFIYTRNFKIKISRLYNNYGE